jgi:biopolymer transport protein ExbB
MNELVAADLTPMGMFYHADAIVRAILIVLAVASLLAWTVLFSKAFELAIRKRALRRALLKLKTARSLATLDNLGGAAEAMMAEVEQELSLSGFDMAADGIKERLAMRISRVEARETRLLQRGTGLLATIGAIAPFVGLFGTVWGIMNSFVSIAQNKSSNLAVVAPGIAEALFATAVGLGAAIPAVVIYNLLGRAIAVHRAELSDASTLFVVIAGRDIDRKTRVN